MKLPGTAQLEFRLDPGEDTTFTQLTMTARFRPQRTSRYPLLV